MARKAAELGHQYLAAHGPLAQGERGARPRRGPAAQAARRRRRLNDELVLFRILTGMEVDILEDGSLDLDVDLLGALDVVVASVHSKLRMKSDEMTRRMVLALASPHIDILGHCTGRKVGGRP